MQSLHCPREGLRKPRGLLQLQHCLLDLLSLAVKMPFPDLLLLPPYRKNISSADCWRFSLICYCSDTIWKFYCSVLVYFLLLDLINTSYFQKLDLENTKNKHNYSLHMQIIYWIIHSCNKVTHGFLDISPQKNPKRENWFSRYEVLLLSSSEYSKSGFQPWKTRQRIKDIKLQLT